jgi:hypothetical protein
MKILAYILAFCCCLPFCGSAQTTIYVSPTGNATVSGSTIGAPTTIVHAISLAAAGTTIYLLSGNYPITATINFNKTGTAANPINLFSYPSNATRPVIDGSAMTVTSSNRGVSLSGSYCYFKGFDIYKAGDNGLNVSGSNNKIEFCYFYENGDTGLQMGGGAANNQVINCDSYYNVDPGQGNADGYAAKLDVGTGNSFVGCRAWQNSDDGWDGYMRPSDDVSTTLDNCWAFKNGYLKDGSVATSGNGNGFKMGGSDLRDLRHNFTLTRCVAFQNKVKGFDQNNNTGNITLHNCTSWNNGTNFGLNSAVTLAAGKAFIVKNCISLTTASSNVFNAATQFATNSWTSGFTVAAADFQSIDPTLAYGARQADGSLPDIAFLHLKPTSLLRNRGTSVGLPFNGIAPDLGAFETAETTPVSLTNVSVKKQFETIVVNWQTASETNNAYFAIERSDNALDFKTIGQVKGAGTTGTPQYYAYFDDIPLPNINYYRIKQVDFDGKSTNSKIIAIDNAVKSSGILKMDPSVYNGILSVDIQSDDLAVLRISDVSGRVVLSKKDVAKGVSTVQFDVHFLPNGVYFLSFVTANGVKTEKFVKQ